MSQMGKTPAEWKNMVSNLPKGEQFLCMAQDTMLAHNINLDIDSVANKNKMSGIVCTIGPASRGVDMLEKLMKAGMGICRLNFSHGTYEYHTDTLKNIREAAKRLPKGRVLGIALDTKGPEIRTGLLEGGATAEDIELKTGSTIRLTVNDEFKEKCSSEVLWCDYKNIVNVLNTGGVIYVDDGLISLQVKEKSSDSLICDVVNGGKLGSKKGCNLPGTSLDLPAVSGKDIEDLQFGVDNKVDMVFASFIQSAQNIREIRKVLGEKGKHIKIIAKIESFSGLWNFMEILEETDGVMVARGDMGIEIPPEKVFLAQKMMISACNQAGKPVICATQMLESMTTKPRATRAESNDVANAILDGADCVMLSGESAKGLYPEEAVKHMAAVCKEAEAAFRSEKMFLEMKRSTPVVVDASQALTMSAVDISFQCMAKAIVTLSETGKTAYMLSSYRPRCPIIMITPSPTVARQSVLYRNIVPCLYTEPEKATWQEELNARIITGFERAMDWGYFSRCEPVVLVVGLEKGQGHTSCVQIITCPPPQE